MVAVSTQSRPKPKMGSKSKNTIKQTCPSFRRGHLPAAKDVNRLRELSLPHVGSFDYFLEHGLDAGISDSVPLEIDLADPKKQQRQSNQAHEENVVASDSKEVDTLKIWLENVKITKPVKSDLQKTSFLSNNRGRGGNQLTPRECRELGLMYSGPITGEFCYQVNHRTIDQNGDMTEVPGKVWRLSKKFGYMPIMVMSKACHLHGSKPDQLVKMKEEVRIDTPWVTKSRSFVNLTNCKIISKI